MILGFSITSNDQDSPYSPGDWIHGGILAVLELLKLHILSTLKQVSSSLHNLNCPAISCKKVFPVGAQQTIAIQHGKSDMSFYIRHTHAGTWSPSFWLGGK